MIKYIALVWGGEERKELKYLKSKEMINSCYGMTVNTYARAVLFTGIMESKNDYIYADTDIVKVLNYEKTRLENALGG